MSDQGPGGPPPQGGQPQQPGGWQHVNQAPPPPPGYNAGQQYPPPPQPPPGYPPYAPQQTGLSPQAAAAISYLTFIPAIIMLVLEPYKRDSYVRFHAFQCLVLTGILIVADTVFGFLSFVALHWLMMMFESLLHLAVFVFWLIAIVKASQGERYHVPGVGDIAENLANTVSI